MKREIQQTCHQEGLDLRGQNRLQVSSSAFGCQASRFFFFAFALMREGSNEIALPENYEDVEEACSLCVGVLNYHFQYINCDVPNRAISLQTAITVCIFLFWNSNSTLRDDFGYSDSQRGRSPNSDPQLAWRKLDQQRGQIRAYQNTPRFLLPRIDC